MHQYTFTVTLESESLDNAETAMWAAASWLDETDDNGTILHFSFDSTTEED